MNSTGNHLCSITLLGNLVNTPTIRYQANPVLAIAELTLATHSRWIDKQTNQTKEWTSYHTVKVIGEIVERSLVHAQKGDVIHIQGYLLNSKKTNREIIHATYAQTYSKGFAQSINQIHCSGEIHTTPKLMMTEHNKQFAEFSLLLKHYVFSPLTKESKSLSLIRPIHVWGKKAQYIAEHGKVGQQVIVDGKLNYLNNKDKNQFIDVNQLVLLKE